MLTIGMMFQARSVCNRSNFGVGESDEEADGVGAVVYPRIPGRRESRCRGNQAFLDLKSPLILASTSCLISGAGAVSRRRSRSVVSSHSLCGATGNCPRIA